MDASHALSAAGCALVTLAVGGGIVLFIGAGGPAAEPGPSTAAGAADIAPEPPPARVDPSAPRPSPEPAPPPDAGRVQDELDRLRFENRLLRGQLQAAVEGIPSPWPDDVPEAHTPEGFGARVADVVAEHEGVDFVHKDCREFPCIGVLVSAESGQSERSQAAWEAVSEALPRAEGKGRSHYSRAVVKGEDGPQVITVFGITPASDDSDLADRVRDRADGLLDQVADKIRRPAE